MKVRYHHDTVGYNFRMTDIHASIGLAQLAKLPGYNERRRAIAARYDAELRGVVTPYVTPGNTHVYHQRTMRTPKSNKTTNSGSLLHHTTTLKPSQSPVPKIQSEVQ